ncbi:DUF421 domain-containing protein [Telluribacter sp. SYSU D00476]|uniref:DUF421 domain-containing protein n=1 Tax=Telluribacter sp. SYSU D00476 TaxID=2811430 RepID=UPI001FF2632E|nr:YetF domain-containing protein [Telluribacter sp. SYSU D00476]
MGEVPAAFYIEIIIRALLVYILLMVCMRALGKRMAKQISRIEMSAMVALASAIGVPILVADRGMLPAFICAAVVVLITRLIAMISVRNQRFEQLTQGDIDILVEDSVMNIKHMEGVLISRERLFTELRSRNIPHLGHVRRVYLEADGNFSVIQQEKPVPGLVTLPYWDTEFINEKLKSTDVVICNNCGTRKPDHSTQNGSTRCPNCGKADWVQASIDR